MTEKKSRGQPKFEPTQDQRNQVKLMKALGIPEDRICKLPPGMCMADFETEPACVQSRPAPPIRLPIASRWAWIVFRGGLFEWQTVAAARAKDAWERNACGR